MQDAIAKGQGNSRYLKSVANFKALYPTYDDFAAALMAGTLPVDFNGKNEAGWLQPGTELNKANVMSDAVAALFGLNSGNVPNDILKKIGEGLPIANGGTGGTSAADAVHNLVSALSTITDPSGYYFPVDKTDDGSSRITYSDLFTDIKTRISSARCMDGVYKGDGNSYKNINTNFKAKLIFVQRLYDSLYDTASFLISTGGESVCVYKNTHYASFSFPTTLISSSYFEIKHEHFNAAGKTYYYAYIG